MFLVFTCFSLFSACKRKDVMEVVEQQSAPKKPRLVFTDLQRRTLQAIFKVCKDNHVRRALCFQCSFLYGNFYTSFVFILPLDSRLTFRTGFGITIRITILFVGALCSLHLFRDLLRITSFLGPLSRFLLIFPFFQMVEGSFLEKLYFPNAGL